MIRANGRRGSVERLTPSGSGANSSTNSLRPPTPPTGYAGYKISLAAAPPLPIDYVSASRQLNLATVSAAFENAVLLVHSALLFQRASSSQALFPHNVLPCCCCCASRLHRPRLAFPKNVSRGCGGAWRSTLLLPICLGTCASRFQLPMCVAPYTHTHTHSHTHTHTHTHSLTHSLTTPRPASVAHELSHRAPP